MVALANAIMRDYKTEGYETQELEVKDDGHGNKGYIVQIRNTSDNAGGFLKKVIGCENCASLILTAKATIWRSRLLEESGWTKLPSSGYP